MSCHSVLTPEDRWHRSYRCAYPALHDCRTKPAVGRSREARACPKTGTSPTHLRPDADMSIIEDVREAVITIPAGFVASYSDIGKRIGAGPRQVGRAMSLLDDSMPWWRVVYADGTPASCHTGRALELLIDDGTPILGARVDMKRARQRWVS